MEDESYRPPTRWLLDGEGRFMGVVVGKPQPVRDDHRAFWDNCYHVVLVQNQLVTLIHEVAIQEVDKGFRRARAAGLKDAYPIFHTVLRDEAEARATIEDIRTYQGWIALHPRDPDRPAVSGYIPWTRAGRWHIVVTPDGLIALHQEDALPEIERAVAGAAFEGETYPTFRATFANEREASGMIRDIERYFAWQESGLTLPAETAICSDR
jgi:hypothetical protein